MVSVLLKTTIIT